MWFDSWSDVHAFAGAGHERAVVPAEARALLTRLDGCAAHYEVREPRRGAAAPPERAASP